MRLPIASLLVLLALSPVANGQSLRCEGRVFLDRDGDGLRDRGEPGIADVGLSDGVRILRSGPDGRFDFRVADGRTVFLIKPAGHAARLRADGTDIIDFGMGNPDMPTPKHIVDKLIETARDPKAGRYSASKGIHGLRKAMAGYYERRFGVKLNPDTEVISTLGSKEGFANLAQALTAPGDVIICPNPAYPIHA